MRHQPQIGDVLQFRQRQPTLLQGQMADDERRFTVDGNPGTQCGIIMAGSREGNVWLRRIP